MSIPEKHNIIKENQERVYEAGKNKYLYDFWTRLQKSGASMSYMRTFGYGRFDDTNFKPQYPIKGTIYEAFISASKLTKIDVDIEITNGSDQPYRAFYGCSKLKTIKKIILSSPDIKFNTNSFQGCSLLENIEFEGVMYNNIYLQHCSKLTHTSLMSVLNCLNDYSEDTSGTTYTCQLGSTNLAKLTTEEKTIATSKGWTLA